MSNVFGGLEPVDADPLLGLMAAARRDPRPGKIDLSVGIYKDDAGATPVMAAVRAAERQILESQATKAYEGPQGNPDFCARIESLALGETSERRVTFMTPGGSGGLFIGFRLAARVAQGARAWMSDPCWPNHPGIARSLGFACHTYRYRPRPDGRADLELMAEDLAGARPGDVLLVQGACHNPTGVDLDPAGWRQLAELVQARGVLPFVDVAYQGFGDGLGADMAPIRDFLASVPEALVSYSCSKNFGLYRERTGALIVQAAAPGAAEAVKGHTARLVRTSYSMPPAHGAAVVATILGDEELRVRWQDELDRMRQRMMRLRSRLGEALAAATGRNSLLTIAKQKGMFSQLPIGPDGAAALRRDHAVYMPESGRINIAGLDESRIDELAGTLAPHISPEG